MNKPPMGIVKTRKELSIEIDRLRTLNKVLRAKNKNLFASMSLWRFIILKLKI